VWSFSRTEEEVKKQSLCLAQTRGKQEGYSLSRWIEGRREDE